MAGMALDGGSTMPSKTLKAALAGDGPRRSSRYLCSVDLSGDRRLTPSGRTARLFQRFHRLAAGVACEPQRLAADTQRFEVHLFAVAVRDAQICVPPHAVLLNRPVVRAR